MKTQNSDILLVWITVPDNNTAQLIAESLVQQRLAACVNIIPGLTSVYRWRGEIHHDSELLLLAKTCRQQFNALRDAVVELHPYEIPEIIATDVTQGLKGYLDWIVEEVGN